MAGDVLGLRYLGKNSDGDFVLGLPNGHGEMTCSNPCKVIHDSNGGAHEYTPDSIMGAAFTDAMNGFLKEDNSGKNG